MPLHAGTAPVRNFSPRISLHAGFSGIQKRPRKQPPKQPHRALLNSCVCSGHRCHIYFVTCPGYPNKTYPLLKLPHHPCPSHFRDICRFLPLLRLQKAVLPAKQSHHHTPVDDKYSFPCRSRIVYQTQFSPIRIKNEWYDSDT